MNKKVNNYENSKFIMASYGMYQFFGQWITGPFGIYVFYFYESEIGLDVRLAALAFLIFSIWNAINDPLTGYIMERVYMPWEKRWGKRFPWIIIGSVPWLFSYLMIFMVPFSWNPAGDKWLLFIWLVISTCLFDTFFTIWTVSVTSMYPDKFRGLNERRTASGIGTILGMTGIATSSIVPPLLISFGVPESFRTAAWVVIGIGFLIFLTMIPGIWESKTMRERYQNRLVEEHHDDEGFFKTAITVLKDKTFLSKVIFFFGYQASMCLLTTSTPYMINFVMGRDSSAIAILMGIMLFGAMVSLPVWMWYSKKLNNNKRLSLYAGFSMFLSFIPMAFVTEFTLFSVVLFFFGIALGAQWFVDPPTMGDVIDNVAVKTGKKQEAIYYGYQAFFIRFGHTFQAIVFAIVHRMTGFVEGSRTRAELAGRTENIDLALFGIQIHTALVPAILILICTLIFWKYYDLTPEKVESNRNKLEEMGL